MALEYCRNAISALSPPGKACAATEKNSGESWMGRIQAMFRCDCPRADLMLEKHIQELERAYIVAAVKARNGVGTRAADSLKMSYRSFRHYSKKYNIN